MLEIKVDSINSNQRVDKYVRKLIPNAPLAFIYKLFRKKDVKINKHWVNINYILKEEDVLTIYIRDDQYESFKNNEFKINSNYKFNHEIIYEDNNILVVNKPNGLLIHGDKNNKSKTLTNDVLNYLASKNEYDPNLGFTPGPVHRLDRNTSGVVVFGKNIEVLQYFLKLFKDKSNIEKEYIALVNGKITKPGKVENRLFKDEDKNFVKVSNQEGSKEAITLYKPIKNYKNLTLLNVTILTGRTHQIRVHMAYINHPILMDQKYGDFNLNKYYEEKYNLKYQCLHANSLYFHDLEGKFSYLNNKKFIAKLPSFFENLLNTID